MSGTAYEDPRTSDNAKVHHLGHLVNAVTNELSACMSLNSLLRQCVKHTDTSDAMLKRTECYHASLSLCQKSLATFAHMVKLQLNLTPGSKEPGLEPGAEGFSQREGGYDSLKVAARECAKVTGLLKKIEVEQEELDTTHRARQWQGWPNCTALEDLEDVNITLIALRDTGGNSDVGWALAWRELVEVDVWLETAGHTYFA